MLKKFNPIMNRIIVLLIILFLNSEIFPQITIAYLPDLPPSNDNLTQKGLAGGFAGISNNALLFAGGANFPNLLPWEGGTKRWWDDIYVLEKVNENYLWNDKVFKLDKPLAYGLSITIPDGVICIGGCDDSKCYDNVFLLEWENGVIKKELFPSLPVPLANMAGTIIDNTIYIAGGHEDAKNASASKHFFSLDLSKRNSPEFQWNKLKTWQGKPRAFAVAVSQSNGVEDCFYLFSGRNFSHDNKIEVLYDAHCYNPSNNKWSILSDGISTKFPVMAGTAVASGTNHILFFGGATGKAMNEEFELKRTLALLKEDLDSEFSKTKKDEISNRIRNQEKSLIKHFSEHKGFSKNIYSYHTITNTMQITDELSSGSFVTTNVIKWGSEFVIPSGEIKPGIRTPKILKISISEEPRQFGFWNYLVLVLYFSVLVWMGSFFSKRQKTSEDYFKGGKRVPWWAAGLSVFGTALSAITFMAIPAKAYATDWSYFLLNMGIVLVAPIISFLFIPFYRRLDVTTAYEYLEKRFNVVSRLIGSISFILFQIGRMGVVLYLPSIALNIVTGIDIFVCITTVGLLSLLYTIMGGVEAVIWTDALQVIILLGGATLSLILISLSVEGGIIGIIQTGTANNKFNIIDLEFSLKQPTIWVMLLAGIFTNITTYGTDQAIVQRYLTTKNIDEAKKTLWTNAVMTIPATLIFFFLGTALFVFYKENPASLSFTISEADAIFPWYIFNELPAGIIGLLISAIFAASMSSVSSSINSGATAYVVDIHSRFLISKKSRELNLARISTLVIGIAGILFAILMATWEISSLWDEFNKIIGLILGGLGGIFMLGMLTKRANGVGAVLGILLSMIIQYIVGINQPVHILLYTSTGFISCFVGGWFFSLLFPSDNKSTKGLTIYSISKNDYNS